MSFDRSACETLVEILKVLNKINEKLHDKQEELCESCGIHPQWKDDDVCKNCIEDLV